MPDKASARADQKAAGERKAKKKAERRPGQRFRIILGKGEGRITLAVVPATGGQFLLRSRRQDNGDASRKAGAPERFATFDAAKVRVDALTKQAAGAGWSPIKSTLAVEELF